MSELIVVYVTVGTAEEADRMAQARVGEQLAACVNRVRSIQSVYRWQGKVEQNDEELVMRARAGRLRASELSAPTIILTSLGEDSAEVVLPIIQPPQVAIVGAGALAERPWVVNGQVVPRQVLTLSLGADHRVTDGRLGAQFLARVAALLADPGAL